MDQEEAYRRWLRGIEYTPQRYVESHIYHLNRLSVISCDLFRFEIQMQRENENRHRIVAGLMTSWVCSSTEKKHKL